MERTVYSAILYRRIGNTNQYYSYVVEYPRVGDYSFFNPYLNETRVVVEINDGDLEDPYHGMYDITNETIILSHDSVVEKYREEPMMFYYLADLLEYLEVWAVTP